MREVHDLSAKYYLSNESKSPNQQAIVFPAQLVYVTYNKSPIVTELDTFLQETEPKKIVEEYFETRMGVLPSHMNHIDTYALGRVLCHNKTYCNTYSKIIHECPNTMEVNHKWNKGKTI